jgi:hypothetical protein
MEELLKVKIPGHFFHCGGALIKTAAFRKFHLDKLSQV